MLRAGMGSVSAVFIGQMQDYLRLGAESRMNTPGTSEGNWRWRLRDGQFTEEVAREIRRITELYGRT